MSCQLSSLASRYFGVATSIYLITVVPSHSQRPIMRMSDVYAATITSILGDEIQLVTKLTWENFLAGCALEEGDCPPTDVFFAEPLVIDFEEGDSFILREEFRGEGRGNIRIMSNEVEIRLDERKTEQYFYRNRPLLKGKIYNLVGEFHYREWTQRPSTQPPTDSTALRQHNDVIYWSQLFEFRLKDIIDFDATSIQSTTFGYLKTLLSQHVGYE